MTALKITYDNTSGLTADTVQAALDELVVNLGSSDSAILALSGRLDTIEGEGYTEGSLKSHEDRLDTLEGTGAGSVADDIAKYAVKLTKMPDGATAVYSQDAWTNLAGLSWVACGHSEANGVITLITSAASGRMEISGSFLAGQIILIRAKHPTNLGGEFRIDDGYNYIYTHRGTLTGDYQIFAIQLQRATNVIGIFPGYFQTGTVMDIDWLWIGDYSYLENSLATEASRIANQLGDTAGVGTKASGTITSNGTNVSDGDTVTIAGKVYTFKTILGTTEGNVLIGGTAAESLDNLKLAINSTGVTAEQYCATFHPLVEATTNTDTMQTLVARSVGILGNSITLAKSATTLTLSGSTLIGGTDDVGQKIYTQVKGIVAGGTRPAQADISDTSTLVGYENSVDVASGGTTTLPAGGTFRWAVYGYGATIASAKNGTSAGGTILKVAGANATVWYRRIA